MGKDVADVHLAAVEVDGSDEPVFVAADVEHDQVTHFVGCREGGSQFVEVAEIGCLHKFKPPREGGFAIRILFPEFAQCLPTDDMHQGQKYLIMR